jgi:hypothetical protein
MTTLKMRPLTRAPVPSRSVSVVAPLEGREAGQGAAAVAVVSGPATARSPFA